MQWAIHAAAPCPVDVKRKMLDWWGPVIWEYYAATEGGGTIAPPDEWLKYPGTVGTRVADSRAEDHRRRRQRACATGEPGTVWMKMGAGDFEYKGDKEKTDESHDAEGFFTVGDVGYLNEDGYLFLCDRKTDMIIAGGVNIYPAEIEGAILDAPAGRRRRGVRHPRRRHGRADQGGRRSRSPGVAADDALRASIMEHVQRPARQVQVAAQHRLHRRAAARADRQAVEAQAPRPVLGRPRPRDLTLRRPSVGSRHVRRRHALTDVFTAHHVLEYPGGYTRSVGPVIGRFLTGLRDGRIEAVRLADGRVLVPPTEYDPTTSARGRAPTATTGSRSGRRGTVQTFTWVAEPRPGKHPLDEAVRVRADPARRRRHRAAARRRLRQRRRDPRRHARRAALARRAHRVRSPTSRRGSRSATARSPSRAPLHVPAEDEQPVTGITAPIRLEYELTAGRCDGALPRRPRRGQDHRRPRAVERRRVRGVARHRPDDRRADVDRGRGRRTPA